MSDLEIRNLLREAGQVLIENSDNSERHEVVQPPNYNMFGEEEPKFVRRLTEGAIKAREMVIKIRKYLKEHPNAEEEAIKRKHESDYYSI